MAALYTDFWAGPAIRKLAFGKLRPLAARHHSDFKDDSELIHSWNARALGWEFLLRKKFSGNQPARSRYHGFIEVGRRFASCVRDDLQWRKDVNSNFIFFLINK